MLTVAYLANQFPCPVEPYVAEEIEELRRRGVGVVAGSVREASVREGGQLSPEVVLQPLRFAILLRAAWMCLQRWVRISNLIGRVIFRGREGPVQRIKALLHTWLGAYYAVLLEEKQVEHIHVHHGYFGSWIAMVAARLLDVGFSMTLHGSDLLLHEAYLDAKLESCAFCLTVSEYNRRYILEHYPGVASQKVVVSRLGVEVSERSNPSPARLDTRTKFTLLSVGRLHAVKDHAFLVRACAHLRASVEFECLIAGEGPERRRLQSLIRKHGLEDRVTLLGYVPREQMDSLYDRADVVLLTSRSEGIPLVLMEAMARGKVVLAPSITGIPELVIPGKTGFLYEPGSMDDFIATLLFIGSLMQAENRPHLFYSDTFYSYIASTTPQLDWIRHAAQVQVRHNFNRRQNLETFGDLFLSRITPRSESLPHEDFILQQI